MHSLSKKNLGLWLFGTSTFAMYSLAPYLVQNSDEPAVQLSVLTSLAVVCLVATCLVVSDQPAVSLAVVPVVNIPDAAEEENARQPLLSAAQLRELIHLMPQDTLPHSVNVGRLRVLCAELRRALKAQVEMLIKRVQALKAYDRQDPSHLKVIRAEVRLLDLLVKESKLLRDFMEVAKTMLDQEVIRNRKFEAASDTVRKDSVMQGARIVPLGAHWYRSGPSSVLVAGSRLS